MLNHSSNWLANCNSWVNISDGDEMYALLHKTLELYEQKPAEFTHVSYLSIAGWKGIFRSSQRPRKAPYREKLKKHLFINKTKTPNEWWRNKRQTTNCLTHSNLSTVESYLTRWQKKYTHYIGNWDFTKQWIHFEPSIFPHTIFSQYGLVIITACIKVNSVISRETPKTVLRVYHGKIEQLFFHEEKN